MCTSGNKPSQGSPEFAKKGVPQHTCQKKSCGHMMCWRLEVGGWGWLAAVGVVVGGGWRWGSVVDRRWQWLAMSIVARMVQGVVNGA